MSLSTSAALQEVATRLAGAPGWPATVSRNRGRLALWDDAAAAELAAGVNDGDPREVLELAAARPLVEIEQPCTIEFLAHAGDDATRAAALAAARASLLDALMPRLSAGAPRDRTLGGLCDDLVVEGIDSDALAVDTIAGVSGFRVRLTIGLTAETLFGDNLSSVIDATAPEAVLTAAGALLIRAVAAPISDPAIMVADAALAPIPLNAAITLDPVSLAAISGLDVTATALIAPAPATLAATAQLVEIGSGVLAVTVSPATLSASGAADIAAAGNMTPAAAILAAPAALTIAGAGLIAPAPATMTQPSSLLIAASASIIPATATLVAAGSAGRVGDLNAQADPATLSASAALLGQGAASLQASPVSLVATGTAAVVTTGQAAIIPAPATLTGDAVLGLRAQAALTASLATLTGDGGLPVQAAASMAADPVQVTQTGDLDIAAAASMIAAPATLAGDSALAIAAQAALVAGAATLASSATAPLAAASAVTTAAATLAATSTLVSGGTPNLIAHWEPYADGGDASGVIPDLSGNGADLVAYDGTTQTAIANWDGIFDGQIYAIGEQSWPSMAAFSVEYWWFEDVYNDFETQIMFRSGNDQAGEMALRRKDTVSGNRHVIIDSNGSTSTNDVGDSGMGAGTWHHSVIILDGSGWRFWTNGNEDTGGARTGSPYISGKAADPSAISIGGGVAGVNAAAAVAALPSGGGDFKGKFAGVKVWDKALSSAEIAATYAAGPTLPV